MVWNEDMKIEDAIVIRSTDRKAVVGIIVCCVVVLALFLCAVA